MKMLSVAIVLLIAIDAKIYQVWATQYNNPGFGNGRGHNFGRGPPWLHPQPQNGYSSDIQWVCQNPKTGDTMIIATDNSPQSNNYGWNQGRPWQNVPPGHQRNNQHGQLWPQGIFIMQEKPTGSEGGNDNNQSPSLPTTVNPQQNNNNNNNNDDDNNNNNNQPRSTPRYHGGEGLIDIRLGKQ